MKGFNLKLLICSALGLLMFISSVAQADWAPGDPNKWVQLPDLTSAGIDIRVDDSDGRLRTLADDFLCTKPGPITAVHLWGSWKYDKVGQITKIHLSFHADDPPGPGGSDPNNTYSKPDKVLWQRDFEPPAFTVNRYAIVDPCEYWWDPPNQELIPGGDSQVWQINIPICDASGVCEPFEQEGTPDQPIIYWLDVRVQTKDGEFGWKTRRWPDHYKDDAVWAVGIDLPLIWNELRYPPRHPYYDQKPKISGTPRTSQAPSAIPHF